LAVPHLVVEQGEKSMYARTVNQAIDLVARALDYRHVGWHNEVDLQTLNMADFEECLMGQLYENYAKGLDIHWDLPISTACSAPTMGRHWLWVEEIKNRRQLEEAGKLIQGEAAGEFLPEAVRNPDEELRPLSVYPVEDSLPEAWHTVTERMADAIKEISEYFTSLAVAATETADRVTGAIEWLRRSPSQAQQTCRRQTRKSSREYWRTTQNRRTHSRIVSKTRSSTGCQKTTPTPAVLSSKT
jgi:hypothetical protein